MRPACLVRQTPDAGGEKGEIAPVVARRQKPLLDVPFQVEGLVIGGSLLNGHFVREGIDYDHDIPVRLSGHLQGIKSGVFEEGAEIPAEVGDPGDAGQGREGDGHGLGRARELGDAPQGAVSDDERVSRVACLCLRRCGLVQQEQTQAAAAQEIVPDLRVKCRGGTGAAGDIDRQNLVGIAVLEFSFAVVHCSPF